MTDLAVIGDRRGPLAKLSDTARTLAAASLSANTRRAYAGALKGGIGRFVRTITVRRRPHSARLTGVLAQGASRHLVSRR